MGLNSPGVPSNQLPPDEAWLVRRVADLERTVRELGPSIAASIKPAMDDIRAAQATLTSNVADIAANVAAINDLLTQVVKSQSVYTTLSNFNLSAHTFSTPLTVIKTVTITVPAGFTAANVEVLSRVFAYNNTAGADFLACQTGITGSPGALDYALGVLVPAGGNGSGVAISPLATSLTNLTPGSTFNITIGANSNFNAWTMAGNVATVSGNILWFR